MSDRNDRTEQAIISLSPTELGEITRIYRLTPERVIVGENGIVGYYESGPEVLKQVALHLNIPDPGWETLSEADQTILVSLMAGSIDWAIDGRLDAYQMDQVLDDETGLRERITTAGQPAAAQPISAIVSAPQAVLERFAQTHGIRLRYIEESENRAHGHYDDGPRALAQLQAALGADPALAPGWDDLTPGEQRQIVGRILRDNPSWIDEQEIGEGAASDFAPDEPITRRVSGLPPAETRGNEGDEGPRPQHPPQNSTAPGFRRRPHRAAGPESPESQE